MKSKQPQGLTWKMLAVIGAILGIVSGLDAMRDKYVPRTELDVVMSYLDKRFNQADMRLERIEKRMDAYGFPKIKEGREQ